MSPSTSSTTVNGFTALPVSYPSSATHYIYARRHEGSEKPNASTRNRKTTDLPTGRTLFLVNVPPDATERELVLLFKPCGTVEKVVLDFDAHDSQDDDDSDDGGEDEDAEKDGDRAMQEDVPSRKRRKVAKEEVPKVVPLPHAPHRTIRKTGLTAYVVFLDASSLDRVSSLATKTRPWSTSSEEPSGLAHYSAMFRNLRPPLDLIQEHVDTYMELFEYKLAKSKQKSKYRKGEAIVDDDGFTLVTRGGAYGKTLGGGVTVASKRFQRSGETSSRRRRPKEKQEKEGFYAFQRAEKQRSELLNLKKKWEEDKAKVEKLKQSRKFKPY
ncbi:hypothetical protein FA13DRAFT_1628529 [Coprinellus micaceus]|uniref:RRM domain-containing protein n=1 Tax=Coprinellus micaceus TaxID=71717 RepID=A0A4Y7TDE7_COPMI|nr:hypothetical protein FA13DRAFT_1628529 [Coprinellus micaceus]